MFAASKTDSVSGSAPDAQFNYVTMLLHGDGTNGAQNNSFVDSSTNNYSITRGGNVGQGSFSPYGSNWSVFFPNLASNLVVANSTPLNLSGGSYTIEGWINPSGIYVNDGVANGLTGYNNIVGKRGYGTNAAWVVYLNTGNGYLGFFNGTNYQSTTTPTAGVWSHFAAVFDGTNISLYLNGSRVYGPTSITNTDYNESVYIGCSTQSGSNEQYRGYLSNLRITKGGALYSGSTYTVPTAPLTTTVSSGTVSLLTCQSNRFIDNSVNNATITINTGLTVNTYGYASVQRFNPFGTTTAYSTSVIGGSASFDGSGDYLSSVNTPANFGTNNFTAEGWYWFNSNTSGYAPIMSNAGSADQQGWVIILESNNTLTALASSGSSWAYNITTTYVPPINVWTHIAYVRNGSTLTLYANGVSIGTASISTNSIGAGSTAFYAGYYPFFPGGARSLNGLISNLRLVNGTAVYTSAFTPPTSQLTAITNTSLLLSTTNGAIIDNAMMNSLKTVGNAQISTSVVKFGTGSMYFDGTGDYLKAPSNSNLLSITPFTVEFWFNTTATLQYTCFIGNENIGGFTILMNSSTSNGIIQVYNGASGLINATTTSYRDGAWHHLALVRDSSGSRLYLDGTQAGSTNASQASASFDSSPPAPWSIGASLFISGRDYVGYIDELRVSKYARYTGSSFTPPTQAFPNTGPI
jgi:hypothetical protein